MRAQNEFEILRNETKICRLISNIHTGTIDKTIYPFVEPPKESKKDKNKDKDKKKAKGGFNPMSFGDSGQKDDGQNILENPRIFVFVVGGISHHEICSIAE